MTDFEPTREQLLTWGIIEPMKDDIPYRTGEGWRDYLLTSLIPGYKIIEIDGFMQGGDPYAGSDDEPLIGLRVALTDSAGAEGEIDYVAAGLCKRGDLTKEAFTKADDVVVRYFDDEFHCERWVELLSGGEPTLTAYSDYPISPNCSPQRDGEILRLPEGWDRHGGLWMHYSIGYGDGLQNM